jgi:hypothetical protein
MTGRNPNASGVSAPGALKTLPADEQQLERDIDAAMARMCAAPDRTLKMQYWREMCGLIDQRTPSRRRFMARIAGLE